jgi:hypothetical protein
LVTIGRLPDNDIVLDDPRVSGYHARLIDAADAPPMIEDIGSSNGTYLNSADKRVTSPTPLSQSDTVYFGTLAVPAARLLGARKAVPPPATRPAPVAPVRNVTEIELPAAVHPAPASLRTNPWLLAWLAQVPVLAIVINLAAGGRIVAAAKAADWSETGLAIASTTFALATAALWLGCSLVVGELALGRTRGRRPVGPDSAKSWVERGKRASVFVGLSAAGSALLLAIVSWGSSLAGPWLSMLVVMALASFVGLAFGLALSELVTHRTTALGVLLASFVPLVVFGGWLWPLPKMSAPLRFVAAAMPSRWAFEGLFVLESGRHGASPAVQEPGTEQERVADLAEDFFPAGSERMGPAADATALGAMMVGLAILTVFISTSPRPER